MRTALRLATLMVAILGVCGVAAGEMGAEGGAELDNQLRKELDTRIAEIRADQKKFDDLLEEGRNRTVLCKTCHGADGKAVRSGSPNLANQDATYIVDQFLRFADGRRNDFLMSNLAKTFEREEMIKIALYYSSLPPQSSGGGKPELQERGAQVFKEVCHTCHGEDGRGSEGYAHLAGQQYEYTLKMLHEFKDRSGRRFNPWMSGVALKLSDEDMEAVATYLANLK
jgi:cytochrome c553